MLCHHIICFKTRSNNGPSLPWSVKISEEKTKKEERWSRKMKRRRLRMRMTRRRMRRKGRLRGRSKKI